MRLQIKWANGWAQVHGVGPDGVRIRRSLGTQDARRAEEARAQLEAKLWRFGLYGAEKVMTFEECAVEYAKDGGDVRFLVPITEQIGRTKLADVTPKAIRDAARRAYPHAANATLNRQAITPARAVINYGHEQGWCPPIKVRHFPTDKPKRQAVGLDYLDKLRPHLPARLYALMMFLHTTGRRIGDAIALRAENVSGVQVFIPKTKNGDEARIVLPGDVAALIAALPAQRDGTVFGYVHRSSVYSTLRRACAKAGVPYLGTHQPGRHSFATALDNAGWGTKAIADAGGWKSTRLVAETYSHPTDSAEKAARHFAKKLASSDKAKQKTLSDKEDTVRL